MGREKVEDEKRRKITYFFFEDETKKRDLKKKKKEGKLTKPKYLKQKIRFALLHVFSFSLEQFWKVQNFFLPFKLKTFTPELL